ncbi:hypothetical protein [Enterobacter hormaechei]|uniref:hypothetical protein n=1 Tax=Enterobacter hormaechei TaxID=158836 RepID=UPI0023F8DED7|nr:hypothetical protein [Enterobacter hormaechei]MDF7702721.1 hypothetical protein [Enterobacter hormaechei subsp. steigerwaltii]
MKITKFGTITVNPEGLLVMKDFIFLHENFAESLIDVNDSANVKYLLSVIANFLMAKCEEVSPKVDFNVERIVADAILKAKTE